jgi:hypothetical protein
MGWNRSLDHEARTGRKLAHLQTEANARASGGARIHRKGTAQSQPANAPLPSSAYPDPEQDTGGSPSAKAKTGIVSVNGCDVGVMHCHRP